LTADYFRGNNIRHNVIVVFDKDINHNLISQGERCV